MPIGYPKRHEDVRLSDIPGQSDLFMNSQVSPDTYDINITYTLGTDGREKNIVFQHINHNDIGIIVYKFEYTALCDALIEGLDGNMHPAIYHFIKEHFHEHKFHDDECDSLLRPYVSCDHIDIDHVGTMELISNHYLDQYLEKIASANEYISLQLAELTKCVNDNRLYFTGLEW